MPGLSAAGIAVVVAAVVAAVVPAADTVAVAAAADQQDNDDQPDARAVIGVVEPHRFFTSPFISHCMREAAIGNRRMIFFDRPVGWDEERR